MATVAGHGRAWQAPIIIAPRPGCEVRGARCDDGIVTVTVTVNVAVVTAAAGAIG